MKAVIYDARTEIFPTREEVDSECKIGQGAETCIFLVVGGDGFECHAMNKMPIMSLIERARRGGTNARREGCERVLRWVMPNFPNFVEPMEVEIQPPEESNAR